MIPTSWNADRMLLVTLEARFNLDPVRTEALERWRAEAFGWLAIEAMQSAPRPVRAVLFERYGARFVDALDFGACWVRALDPGRPS